MSGQEKQRRNFKFILQYEGTRYQGWQKQESTENTIQGKLEALLSKMCGEKWKYRAAAGRMRECMRTVR